MLTYASLRPLSSSSTQKSFALCHHGGPSIPLNVPQGEGTSTCGTVTDADAIEPRISHLAAPLSLHLFLVSLCYIVTERSQEARKKCE